MKSSIKSEKPLSQTKRIQKIRRNISGWVLIIPSIILFTVIVWRPIVIGISYSFFNLKGFVPTSFAGLRNYIDVLSDTNFLKTLWNTVMYVFWSIVTGYPVAFICAVMLNEMLHAKSFVKISLYLPAIIPSIAVAMIWKMIYLDGAGGLLNMIRMFFGGEPTAWLGNKNLVIPLIVVSMTWKGCGSTMILYLATMQGINQELYDAARLDGAGFFGRIRYVLYPHMKGTLLLLLVQQMIGVFSITEQPLTMTGGGPNGASMSLGLTNYFYAFKYGQYSKSLSMGVITFLLLISLTFVYNRLEKSID